MIILEAALMRTKVQARAAVGLGMLMTSLLAVTRRGATEPAKVFPQQPDTSAVTPATIDAGRRIFHGKGMCFGCHGMRLEGGPVAPPLGPHQWKDATGGELGAIFYVDTHGVAGTVMISHPGGISDAEAAQVASYIWAVSHRGAKP
jgi:mono/diheme cytochrome c family protein